jgi:hypothetical protein
MPTTIARHPSAGSGPPPISTPDGPRVAQPARRPRFRISRFDPFRSAARRRRARGHST